MPLASTADKKTQIAFINKMETVVQALLDYANGDENALDALNRHLGSEPAPTQQAILPEVSNVVQMPSPGPGRPVTVPDEDKCTCAMAVKDKHSSTHLCLLCNKNAYANHYVLSHTPEGQALRNGTGPVTVAPEMVQPAESTMVFLPAPAELAPCSDEEAYGEDEE